MKYGVCYYILGCIEPYLEFVEDESLECVIHRVKTNDFTGVRFARTGLDEVPYINICDESGYCLYRMPVTELQHNSFGYILDNYGDDDSLDVNTAEQGEPVDVENTSASEQGNTVKCCRFCFDFHKKRYQRKSNDNLYCCCPSSSFHGQVRFPDDTCSCFRLDVFRSGG